MKQLLKSFNFLFGIFVILNVFDYISTKLVIDIVGPSGELNPIMQYAIVLMGMNGVLLVKSLVLPFIWFLKKHVRPIVLIVMNVVFALTVISNMVIYMKLLNLPA